MEPNFFPDFGYKWADRAPADMLYNPDILSSSYRQYAVDLPWYPGKFLGQTTSSVSGSVNNTLNNAVTQLTNVLVTGMLLFFGLIAGILILVFGGIIVMNIVKKK